MVPLLAQHSGCTMTHVHMADGMVSFCPNPKTITSYPSDHHLQEQAQMEAAMLEGGVSGEGPPAVSDAGRGAICMSIALCGKQSGQQLGSCTWHGMAWAWHSMS